MDKSLSKKTVSHKPLVRPGTYTVHSTSTIQAPPDGPKNFKSQTKGQLISQGDQNKAILPCIDKHTGVGGSRLNLAATPIELRMAIRLNKVDSFKKSTEKPPGALPPMNLPLWDQWPLDAKIPDFRNISWPTGSVYFTRGKLSTSLCYPRMEFNLSDPKGYKNAFQLADYTALHDPHAVRYFQQRNVVPLLREKKLINANNEVLCTTKDYNRFRTYLATLQSEGVNKKIQKEVEKRDFLLKVRKPFQEFQKKEQDGDKVTDRHIQAQNFRNDLAEQKELTAKRQVLDWQSQNESFELWKRHERYLRTQELPTEDYLAAYRLKKVHNDQIDWRKRILGKQIYDMKQSTYNQKYDKLIGKVLKERLDIDKVITLKKRDEQMLELKDVIDETVRRRKEKWCKRYEKHIKYSQDNQAAIQAALRAKAARELRLQRKYFDLWRAFIKRKHTTARPDSVHTSTWKIEKDMKSTVAFLEEESGYDPSQNFFFQLLHNAKNVQDWAETQKRKTLEIQKERDEKNGGKKRKSSSKKQKDKKNKKPGRDSNRKSFELEDLLSDEADEEGEKSTAKSKRHSYQDPNSSNERRRASQDPEYSNENRRSSKDRRHSNDPEYSNENRRSSKDHRHSNDPEYSNENRRSSKDHRHSNDKRKSSQDAEYPNERRHSQGPTHSKGKRRTVDE